MVSFAYRDNAAPTGGTVVTVTGVNFRTEDMTPTSNIDYQQCGTASWTSKSSVACTGSAGSAAGADNDVYITASAIVGSRTRAFTFDGFSSPGFCIYDSV